MDIHNSNMDIHDCIMGKYGWAIMDILNCIMGNYDLRECATPGDNSWAGKWRLIQNNTNELNCQWKWYDQGTALSD